MGGAPRYSIVIPTRDRPHTLRHAIRTCLAQQFDDAEFLVSDNGSDAATRNLVAEFADRRLRYVHTPRPLAMTDSWEFAVGQAAGEFITVIGDDDGLLLHALPEIDRILRMTGGKVLRWEAAYYYWPCVPSRSDASPNRLFIPLRRRRRFDRIRRRAGRSRLAKAARWKTTYAALPMIYRAMVHRSVLTKLREQTGRIFYSLSPDVYSAFAIAHAAGEFLSVDTPIGLGGTSGKSNALNFILNEPSAIVADFFTLNDEAGIRWHKRAPDLKLISPVEADSYLHAQDKLFPTDRRLALDRRKLISRCVDDLYVADETEWQQALAKMRASLIDNPRLVRWFDRKYASMPWPDRPPPAPPRWKRYDGSYLRLDTSEFGVTNVFEAAELFEKVMGYRAEGVDARPVKDVRVRLALIADRVSAKLRTIRGKLATAKLFRTRQPEA
jgi:Glycosyl transferase family 2